MLLELAKPVTLLASVLSLSILFHTAFLEPATNVERLQDALGPFLLAAAMALVCGLVFLSDESERTERHDVAALLHTFPMRVFCWATVGMGVFFLLAWYLEAHAILYRDTRF
jgi:hypothetical protein